MNTHNTWKGAIDPPEAGGSTLSLWKGAVEPAEPSILPGFSLAGAASKATQKVIAVINTSIRQS